MSKAGPGGTQPARLGRGLRRLREGARNALDFFRAGGLSEPYHAPYRVALEAGILSLRRYEPIAERRDDELEPLLLVPPLMVTAEIYDISPDLSAVAALKQAGLDVWVTDFGAPERADGGMQRTLDDHVLAVSAAIVHIRQLTGRPVHVAGYSQGGIFAYQAAAYREGRDVASVVTFGSPVDMRRALPLALHDTLVERVLGVARRVVDRPFEELAGLPGTMTSVGFKLLSPRQELRHILRTVGNLHDREALSRLEPKRRFLAGDGFTAWPGPAFRDLVDELFVANRMAQGGMVIAGRAVSLADLRLPILYFVGGRDEMGRPAAVRGIERAAPQADVHGVEVASGHFGLVVGARALEEVWPTVAAWVRWRSGEGPMPAAVAPAADVATPPDTDDEPWRSEADEGRPWLARAADSTAQRMWDRLGQASIELTGLIGSLRWQLPRLGRLVALTDDARTSLAATLADQASAIPDATFFLFGGRAFTFREADERVDRVAAALLACGVRAGQHVGVLMEGGLDYLTVVAALSRLGAVAALLHTQLAGESLDHAVRVAELTGIVTDPERAARAGRALRSGLVVTLGRLADGESLPPRAVRLEDQMTPGPSQPPPMDYEPNPGTAGDLAMLIFTSGATGLPKAARISNRRWVVTALGSAAACELTPRDTVYCCLPLHHATAMLLACGGALLAGSRLAVAPRFSASGFWDDVRRYGATVVPYVGELCHYLVSAPIAPKERKHPVRLFVGNGLHAEVWRRFQHRFAVPRILEFYGSTEGNVVLANLTGRKIGSVGREVMTQGNVALARWDIDAGALVRGPDGRLVRCEADEPGVLLARVTDTHPMARFDGYLGADDPDGGPVVHGAFEDGDAYFVTGDLLRRDADGDHWFVDRLGDTFRWKGENASTEQVARVVEKAPDVRMVVVFGVPVPGREGRAGMAVIELAAGAELDGAALFELAAANLPSAARPRFVRVVERLNATGDIGVDLARLRAEGPDPGRHDDPVYWYDEGTRVYAPLDFETYARLTATF